MRQFTFQDKTYKMNERDWKQLVKRFDVDKAVKDKDRWFIDVECICKYYGFDCKGCPFHPKRDLSCDDWLESIFGDYLYYHIRLGLWDIHWFDRDNEQARQEINKIRQALLDMRRLENPSKL